LSDALSLPVIIGFGLKLGDQELPKGCGQKDRDNHFKDSEVLGVARDEERQRLLQGSQFERMIGLRMDGHSVTGSAMIKAATGRSNLMRVNGGYAANA